MIYIQSNNEQTIPHHGDAASAMYGAIDSGLSYKLISFDTLKLNLSLNLNIVKINTFVGSTEFMREIWDILGKNPRVPENSDREHERMTLKQIRDIVTNSSKELFVKPVKIKLFTGLIVNRIWINSLREFPDDTELMVYKVLPPILAEWRVYVHNHKIVDIKNYSGGLFVPIPKQIWIDEVIKKNKKTFPCAYTIDVATLDTMFTNPWTVIEYNDMWAIGNYGMPNDLYLRMLRDRYFEIVNS